MGRYQDVLRNAIFCFILRTKNWQLTILYSGPLDAFELAKSDKILRLFHFDNRYEVDQYLSIFFKEFSEPGLPNSRLSQHALVPSQVQAPMEERNKIQWLILDDLLLPKARNGLDKNSTVSICKCINSAWSVLHRRSIFLKRLF